MPPPKRFRCGILTSYLHLDSLPMKHLTRSLPRLAPALLLAFGIAHAQQQPDAKAAGAPAAPVPAPQPFERTLKAESAVSKSATVMIKGKAVPYKVTAGTQPVWDKDGKVIASLFYTYYQRSDVPDKAKRPLVLSFNGGPGWTRPEDMAQVRSRVTYYPGM
eukprot:gene42178-52294_t